MKLTTTASDHTAVRYTLAALSLLFLNQETTREVSAAAVENDESLRHMEESNQIKVLVSPNSNAIRRISMVSSNHSKELSRPTVDQRRQVDGIQSIGDLPMRWLKHIQEQMMQHSMQQQISEKDHTLMEKWLVDNIKDLHRELKQTETDFEHYVQVTKNIMARTERQLQQQAAMTVPASFPFQPVQFLSHPMETVKQQAGQPLRRLIFAVDTMNPGSQRWV